MMVQCVRCKTFIDQNKYSLIRLPGAKRKAVCMSCHRDWEVYKDRVWKLFIDPPKHDTGRRGLNAFELSERGLLDAKKETRR